VDWLNLDFGALRLPSLIAGLVVAASLVAISWKYRKRRLLEAAPASAPEQAAELEIEAAMRRDLRVQVALLTSVLNELPPADSSRLTEAMLNCDDLREFSFVRFRTLASEIDEATDAAAAAVETNMLWLSDLIRQVRALPSGIHYDWKKFPRLRYNEVLRMTRHPLREIAQHLELPKKEPP
jgi:hypothetical protein